MSLIEQLKQAQATQFVVVILDNEVTVPEFVVEPALPWTRIVQIDGVFQFAAGYPTKLTAEQGKFEMKNWDEVSLGGIYKTIAEIVEAVDMFVVGNNAGQGLPLAQAIPQSRRVQNSAIIFAASLPEQSAYERLGFVNYWCRRETVAKLLEMARAADKQLALYFINTIQHNQLNYHDP